MDFLHDILKDKRAEVADSKRRISLGSLREKSSLVSDMRDFKGALRKRTIAVVAEIKKASPSRGSLTEKFDHLEMALQYQGGGAAALSVLTDKKVLQGDKSFIQDIKVLTRLPVLRKDFIIDEYQVYESKVLGADALLLIVRALSKDQLRTLFECARSVGLGVLVETHSEDEIQTANEIGADIIGVNNRDLVTFEVDLRRSVSLRTSIHPGAIAVSESGILTAADVRMLADAGFHSVLVGEGLIRTADRSAAIRSLIPE